VAISLIAAMPARKREPAAAPAPAASSDSAPVQA
jgi:hypothetical protein